MLALSRVRLLPLNFLNSSPLPPGSPVTRKYIPPAFFKEAGLILEQCPVVSHYLHGKSGRPADDKKLVYSSQGAITLLAHKTANFICNGGGPRPRGGVERRASARAGQVQAPRTPELDRIGVVVSLNHPASGTNLHDSTAELLLKR